MAWFRAVRDALALLGRRDLKKGHQSAQSCGSGNSWTTQAFFSVTTFVSKPEPEFQE